MKNQSVWSPLGLVSAALSCVMLTSVPVEAASFFDTSGHWAETYIEALSSAGIIRGFPDNTFRPNQPVTRAQFATIVNNAFQLPPAQGFVTFWDVPTSYWAAGAISTAAANNLVAGFPNGAFQPEQPVTRTQTWVVLVNGLQPTAVPASDPNQLFSRYRDAAAIPNWALAQVATADQSNLIINFPDPALLEPNRVATRAEVAAFTYQALVQRGQTGSTPIQATNPQTLPSSPSNFNLRLATVPAGSILQVASAANQQLLVAPNETRPYSLTVLNPILNQQGDIIVPYGSRVDGRFEPAAGGSRFVAESVIIDNQMFPLAAQSDVLRDIKDPRQTNSGQVVQDAAIGAAAGAILGLVTGDQAIATEEVLAAGVAGAAIGNVTAPRVVVIDPQQPIPLRLTNDLVATP